MKFRIAFLILLATLLTACNFSLAEDITPPPGYVAPTPMPTLGPLFPAQTPSVANGAVIYAEKCLPCHGETGMGDGEKGIQLGVTVSAFGLPEIARPASPAQWYTTVTRGRMDRFMPPFTSLTDQERWDVITYVRTLHTSAAEIQKGKKLFETDCKNCSTDFFKNQEKMSALSDVDLARLVKQGNGEVQAFGKNYSDTDLWAVAAYLRSLSFDSTPLAQATVAPVTETSVAVGAGTPSAEGTPVGTQQASAGNAAQAGFGVVSGTIENKTGAALPSDLAIKLHGYEHSGTDPNAGPQEVLTLEGIVNSDGTFAFENVELPENRIFVAETNYQGVSIQSDLAVVEKEQTSIALPALVLYKVVNDSSVLVVDELHIFVDVKSQDTYDLLALFTFHNPSESIVALSVGNQQEIPFLKFPTGSKALGYEAMQDSAPFLGTDTGFAMPPNEKPYGILAYSSVPKEKETSITQSVVLPVTAVRVFIPDGMKLKSDLLTQDSPQDVQGTKYQSYAGNNLKAGETLTFTLSGTPKTSRSGTESNTSTSSKKTLLIGAGGLGLALILAGVWMYIRDRKRAAKNDTEEDDDDEEEESEFDTAEDVMDAILALDDLHRAKKIADEAYHKRRAELKEILKGMM